MQTILVSDEIADQIDKSQFGEEDEISDASEHIIIMLEFEDVLIPGLIEKYSHKSASYGEEISLTFMTETKNIIQFQRNMNNFRVAKLMLGAEEIGSYDLVGMTVEKIMVEQSPGKAGCVITVVYK